MAVEQTAAVWRLDLPHNEAWVLMALADHADPDGKRVYPALGYIAWKTNYQRRHVRRIMGSLKAKGIIEPISHSAGGRSPSGKGYATEYWLHMEKADKKSPYTSEASERGALETALGGPGGPARGAVGTAKGDIAVAPQPSVTTIEPSGKPSIDTRANGAPQWLVMLRTIDGWADRGEKHVESLMKWVAEKGWSDAQLEASALGLITTSDRNLKGYRTMAGAFQRRLNQGYDRIPLDSRQPETDRGRETSGRAAGWDNNPDRA